MIYVEQVILLDYSLMRETISGENYHLFRRGVKSYADGAHGHSLRGYVMNEFSESDDWKAWRQDFTNFRKKLLPKRLDLDNQARVRLTVIDTGIDASHPYVLEKRWASKDEYAVCEDRNPEGYLFCDFVEPDSPRKHVPIDLDGHGTFIAGILLQVAPDIELSIARIGVDRKSMADDAEVGKKISSVSLITTCLLM